MMCRIDILCYISIRIDFWDRFMFRLGKGWLTTRLELQDSIGNLNFDRFAALTPHAGSTKSLELIVTVWALGLETWFDFMKFWIYIFGSPKFPHFAISCIDSKYHECKSVVVAISPIHIVVLSWAPSNTILVFLAVLILSWKSMWAGDVLVFIPSVKLRLK